jgi:putative transposase
MSRKGNGWDNAVMERFIGSLKSERSAARWLSDQRYLTQQQAREDIVYYIEMEYNRAADRSNRLHSTSGYLTPQEKPLAVAA